MADQAHEHHSREHRAADQHGRERRRESRVPITLAAELWVSGQTYIGRIKNLSIGGAYVEFLGDRPIASKEKDNAWLFAPTLGESAAVELRHACALGGIPTGAGVKFRDPSAGVRNRIRRLLDSAGGTGG
jgi:hypothetical protein